MNGYNQRNMQILTYFYLYTYKKHTRSEDAKLSNITLIYKFLNDNYKTK